MFSSVIKKTIKNYENLHTLIGCLSTTKDLRARIKIPVADKINNTAIAVQALKEEEEKKSDGDMIYTVSVVVKN